MNDKTEIKEFTKYIIGKVDRKADFVSWDSLLKLNKVETENKCVAVNNEISNRNIIKKINMQYR